MDEYGLTQEQREAIDDLIPGWQDMRPAEIQQRAAAIAERFEAEAEEFYELRDLLLALIDPSKP